MKGRALVSLLTAAVAVVALSACSSSSDSDVPGTVKATNQLRFDPPTLKVRLNAETIVTFKNTDKSRVHNFTISYVFTDLDNFVNVDAKPGEIKDVKFTVKDRPASGYLTFYCTYHQGRGMQGRIKVV